MSEFLSFCRVATLIAALAMAVTACTTTPPVPPYDQLQAQAQQGDFSRVNDLRARWLEQTDAIERLQRLGELETQSLQMFDQPLRMGALGNTMVELYPGSLLGHMALQTYYERVGSEKEAAQQRDYAQQIATHLAGEGTLQTPYQVLSGSEANALVRFRGETVVGATYLIRNSAAFGLTLLASPGEGQRLREVFFDLTPTYQRIAAANKDDPEVVASGEPFSSQRLAAELARAGDSAAQAAIGLLLLEARQSPPTAIHLLNEAVSTGNVFARLALGQAYLAEYGRTEEEDQKEAIIAAAAEQLRLAAASGSDLAAFHLGRLKLSGLLGDEQKADGVALIEKSADLGNSTAMMGLAQLYLDGQGVAKSKDKARELIHRAAETGNEDAQFAYAQFQLNDEEPALDQRGETWLRALADERHPGAVIQLATLLARGKHVSKDLRGARKLLREAGTKSEDPELVNNAAWTLTVSDEIKLRDTKAALAFMSKMMENNERARANPAYLDTWAAAYAANGRWDSAVETQQRAIAQLKSLPENAQQEMLPILTEHLEQFRRRETITEEVP